MNEYGFAASLLIHLVPTGSIKDEGNKSFNSVCIICLAWISIIMCFFPAQSFTQMLIISEIFAQL
jgi:hypothetical protein